MKNIEQSPHLTVYKPQISSTLSIFHRITGAILALYLLFYVLIMSFCSISTITLSDLTEYVSLSPELTSIILDYAYINIAFFIFISFVFHLCHGIRHFFWDQVAGSAFTNKGITTAGIAASAITVSLSILAIFV